MAVVLHPSVGAPAQPRVSVCIANYNGEALLCECIDSVLAQDAGVPLEILVHDDASQDGSLAMLRERYAHVCVLASDENVGFCIANNRMAESARGDYLLLLNNDAALYPDAIRHLLSESERIAAQAILTVPQYDWATGELVDRGCLLDPFYTPVPNLDPARDEVAYVIGACMFLPRTLWHELGGFPSWFGSIAEDMFLCCAARLRGVPVRCAGNSGYRHRQGATFGGNRVDSGRLRTRYRRRYLSERNRMAVLASCTPTLLALPWLALHASALVAEAAALCLYSRQLRPWREVYAPVLRDFWRDRRKALTTRRSVQASRSIHLSDYLRGFSIWPRKLHLVLRHGAPRFE